MVRILTRFLLNRSTLCSLMLEDKVLNAGSLEQARDIHPLLLRICCGSFRPFSKLVELQWHCSSLTNGTRGPAPAAWSSGSLANFPALTDLSFQNIELSPETSWLTPRNLQTLTVDTVSMAGALLSQASHSIKTLTISRPLHPDEIGSITQGLSAIRGQQLVHLNLGCRFSLLQLEEVRGTLLEIATLKFLALAVAEILPFPNEVSV